MNAKIRIVIIEDTAANCAVIATLLKDDADIEICGMTEDVSHGVKLILKHLPDAVFLHSHETYYHNFGILEELKQHCCNAPVIFTIKSDKYFHDIVRTNSFSCLRKPIAEKMRLFFVEQHKTTRNFIYPKRTRW